MASGDLTCTFIGRASTGAGVKTLVDTVNLTATTDMLKIVPMANGQEMFVFKIVREA